MAHAPGLIDPAPTYVTPSSFDDACRAAGAAMAAVDAVLDGRAGSAFALARPPGHHARPAQAMAAPCRSRRSVILTRNLPQRSSIGSPQIVALEISVSPSRSPDVPSSRDCAVSTM